MEGSKYLRSVLMDDDAYWAKKRANTTILGHLEFITLYRPRHLEKVKFFIAMGCNTEVADRVGRTTPDCV